jgi:hypothetical protein
MVDERRADEALRALFAGMAEPGDDGFSGRVMARIGARIRRRRLVIAVAVLAGALVAAWPVAQLLLQFSSSLRTFVAGFAGTDWLADYQTLLAGAALAFLTPVVAALLED